MKIIFMGTPEFSIPSLKAVASSHHELLAVVTNEDEPQGRGQKMGPPPVKLAANELGLPVIQVSSLKDQEFVGKLESLRPDVIVVVAFRILPKEVFSIASRGTFNLHASLLPKYRGAAPINWAIINGERETGVTTFFLDEKVDTGKIIMQKKTGIGENETAGELAERLSVLGAEVVLETLEMVDHGNVRIISQDNSLATKAPKISKEDCLIDWKKNADSVHNFVRGFSPHPGAFTFLSGKSVRIFRTLVASHTSDGTAGALKAESGRLFVSCGVGELEIVELQLEGKKKLGASDFLRGARLDPDSTFSGTSSR